MNYSGGPPSSKTHKTAVVLIPPQEAWPSIQAIRQVHDRHLRRWMPHITLLYPFRSRHEFGTLAGRFAQACAEIVAFEVELATFQWFRHRSSYTLWLAPEPKEPLLDLQTALWRLVPDCDEVRRVGDFTPHLSVGQVRGREALKELLAELRCTWAPVHFWASKVSLIWRNDPPDDVFRIAHTVRLGRVMR